MNKRTRASLVVLVTVILLLALIVPVKAKKADNFSAHIDLVLGADPFTAVGTYSMTYNGVSYGEGDAFLTYIPRYFGVNQGAIVLEDWDEYSQMVIRFSNYYIGDVEGCSGIGGLAQYKILFERNVGDYDLMGNGAMELCNMGQVGTTTLVGWAMEVP